VAWSKGFALGVRQVRHNDAMPAPAHRIRYTYGEYLALEASSNVKHEFLDGQIYAMAGGTPEHAALAAAVIGLLFGDLRGGACRAYDADLRVRTPTGLATYPDVTVVCGPSQRDSGDAQAVINPILIVDVLSRSTEEYDRGDKFEHYKSLATLKQYVLVSSRERTIDVWTRQIDRAWTAETMRDGQVASLASVGATLAVRDLYDAAGEPRSGDVAGSEKSD
jgi:Uma2 family endonuclease